MESYFGFFVEDFLGYDVLDNTSPCKAACACHSQGGE